MSLKVRSIKQAGERWASGMIYHGLETTRGVVSMANLRKVLWMMAPRLRIVNYRSKQTPAVTIPKFMLRHMRVSQGDYLEFVPRRNGWVMIRKASERKVRYAFCKFRFLRAELELRRRLG